LSGLGAIAAWRRLNHIAALKVATNSVMNIRRPVQAAPEANKARWPSLD
jgi:hypothetical protein